MDTEVVRLEAAEILTDPAVNLGAAFKALDRFGVKVLLIDDVEELLRDLQSFGAARRLLLDRVRSTSDKQRVIATARYPESMGQRELEAFDSRLPVLYPDENERLDILRVLTRDVAVPASVDLSEIARTTEWWSGAELSYVIEHAFRRRRVSVDEALQSVGRGVDSAKRKQRVQELLAFTESYCTDSEIRADALHRYSVWLGGLAPISGKREDRGDPQYPKPHMGEQGTAEEQSMPLPPLDLHPFIAAACLGLWKDRHYAEAVRTAAVALEILVKERSGYHEKSGVQLMGHVFSPEKPLLAFNALSDQSDVDEQKGMMMLFQGVVYALRNPRSHKLLEDSVTGAQEAITVINVLARRLGIAQSRGERSPL
jgi:uncharacterized protein (TIGR02391 family)